MQDRLQELKGVPPQPSYTDQMAGANMGGNVIQMQEIPASPMVGQDFMSDFYGEIPSIKETMALIATNIKTLEESYQQTLVLAKDARSSDELEALIDATNLGAVEVRGKLKELDLQTKRMSVAQQGTAAYRIRKNMQVALTRKFLDLMAEYQEVQTNYRNKYKEKLARQYKIVKPEASSSEIEQVVESGNPQIFATQILDMQQHGYAKEALGYMEDRHRDVVRLEQSIQELHQLFLDVSLMVETQGEMVDQIEYNVGQTVAYTKEGVAQLQKAEKHKKRSRKRLFCIILCLLIILGVGIGVGVSVPLALKK